MNHDEHKARHVALHNSLDELLADFVMQNPNKRLSNTTLMDLLTWSHIQTQKPTGRAEDEHMLPAQVEPENLQDKIFKLELQIRSLEEDNAMLLKRLEEVIANGN